VTASPPPKARRASYREGAGFGALSFLAMGVIGLVSSIAIARVYGIDAIGAYALVMAPTNAVWYLSSARERPAFVRELATLAPRAPRITALFWAMLAFSFGLTLVVSGLAAVAIYFAFKGPIGRPDLFLPALAYLASYLLVLNTSWNYDAVFLGFRAGREQFWIRVHLSVAFLIIAVAFGLMSTSVWGLVAANLGSGLTSLAHRIVVVRRYMATLTSREELRKGFRTLPGLIRFGLKIVPGSLATGITYEVATWTLGVIGPIAALGAYNRAQTLTRRLGEIDYRLTGMLLPTLVERRTQNDHTGFDRALLDTVRYAAVLMLLPAAAGGGAAYGVMELFGSGFSAASDALALMLLMPMLMSCTAIQCTALYAVDRPLSASLIAVAAMLVTIAATIGLAPPLGITGAALGLVAGGAVNFVWTSLVARRHLSRPVRTLWHPREALALVLAFGAGFAAARLVDASLGGLVGLLPALLAGTAAYAGVFAVAGGINDRDRKRLAVLGRRLRRRRMAGDGEVPAPA
jgi:O-antigen/teichoic acid export membrane protein